MMKNEKENYWSVLLWLPLLSLGIFISDFTDSSIPETEISPENNVPCSLQNEVFESGEKLTYKIYYNWNFIWLGAGEITFIANEKEDYYVFKAYGSTYSTYEWFYKVEDYYEAHVDKETMLPTMSVRSVDEGEYRQFNRVEYDWENNRAVSWIGDTPEETERSVIPLDQNCIYDILTMLYVSRNIDITGLQQGESFPVNILLDEEKYNIGITFTDSDPDKKIKKLGRFETKKFEPELIAGNVFDEGNKMKIWIGDDENKIPLLIESPVSVGSVKAVLKSHQNLKYPLESRND